MAVRRYITRRVEAAQEPKRGRRPLARPSRTLPAFKKNHTQAPLLFEASRASLGLTAKSAVQKAASTCAWDPAGAHLAVGAAQVRHGPTARPLAAAARAFLASRTPPPNHQKTTTTVRRHL
jgi:hypothetical protein